MQQGRVINLDVGRVVTARQFGNKLWQAARFTLTHLEAQNDAASSGLVLVEDILTRHHRHERRRLGPCPDGLLARAACACALRRLRAPPALPWTA